MKTSRFTLKALAISMFILVASVATQAQATRTWVSGVGDDVNPCSRTAPCKTWAGAISKTAVNGEINALDPGGFGTLTITKSITVDGTNGQGFGSTLNAGVTGFTVSYDFFAGTDTRKSVRLRNLSVHGADTGTNGVRIIGAATSGSEVMIENVTIDGNNAGTGRGISDERSGGGKLFVHNVTISNCSGTGIVIIPASGSTRIDATIRDARIFNCAFGIVASSGSRVSVANSSVAGCTNHGLGAEGPLGASEMHVENTVSSNNGTGVLQAAGGTIRLSNNTITFNGTGITGTTFSYGNNKIAGNGAAGTAPTAIGGVSSTFGQQ